MAETRSWPALQIDAPLADESGELDGWLSAALTDFAPTAIHDLVDPPLPPGGHWDPTVPAPPEPAAVPLRWRVFFASPADRGAARAALAGAFPGLVLTEVDVPDADWAAASQRSLTAIRAGRFIVAPTWDVPSSSDDETLIVIEPSMGFGTGHHASTRLCLRALSGLRVEGRSVIDIGTGSGVLAIAAAMRGALRVTGIDVDADAVANARHNATLNRPFLPPDFETGDFRECTLMAADLVMANLTGGLIRSAAAAVRALVAPGGTLVVSGFEADEAGAVRQALGDLSQDAMTTEDGWTALTLTDSAAAPPRAT